MTLCIAGRWAAERVALPDAKREDFDRLWNTDNRTKRTRFRNYLQNKLMQIKVPRA